MKNRNPISSAVVIYLILMLAGFALGTFPGIILKPSQNDSPVLYSLWGVLGAQVFFFMLIYPLVWMRRSEKKIISQRSEVFLMLIATLPFYIAADWFSNNTVTDFLILALVLAVVIIWSGISSVIISKTQKSWAIIMFVNILFTLGTLSAFYIAVEFF